jgi:hypothetical protein
LIKGLRFAEIVEKITMKKRIITGVAELTILNMEAKCGGAV